MSNPLAAADVGGNQVNALSDLGFTSPLGADATQTSVAMPSATTAEPCSCDVFVIIKLHTSGSVSTTLNFQQASTAAAAVAMGSPVANVIADANEHVYHFVVSESTPYWALQLVEGEDLSTTLTEFTVLDLVRRGNSVNPVNFQSIRTAAASQAILGYSTSNLTLTPQ